ncbi:MAG: hypothetical protein WCK31_02900 [bacterium]
MNILDGITPQHILAIVLIIYLVICLIGYFSGILKILSKSKSNINFIPYLKGQIPNPGFPNNFFNLNSIKKKKSTKKLHLLT